MKKFLQKQKVKIHIIQIRRLFYNLRYGQRMFVLDLKCLIFSNKKAINELFTPAMIFLFFSNIIFVIEWLLNDFDYSIKIWISFHIMAQTCLSFLMISFLHIHSEHLYKSSKLYQNFYISLSQKITNKFVLEHFHLAMFLEVINPKKRFCFTFGSIGKIHFKNLGTFTTVYSSFLMIAIPLIKKNSL